MWAWMKMNWIKKMVAALKILITFRLDIVNWNTKIATEQQSSFFVRSTPEIQSIWKRFKEIRAFSHHYVGTSSQSRYSTALRRFSSLSRGNCTLAISLAASSPNYSRDRSPDSTPGLPTTTTAHTHGYTTSKI